MTQSINSAGVQKGRVVKMRGLDEKTPDQADGLRRMVKDQMNGLQEEIVEKPGVAGQGFPRVVAVTSGKGGVGKTNIVGNLAIALSRMGKRVLILDGDLGLANIDIIYGLHPEFTIKHVLTGEKDLKDVIVKGPEGVSVIPASSGLADLVHLTQGEKLNLLSEFDGLEEDYDIFLIDTGAGISSNIVYFNAAARERIVIATPEPTSITDAYALMKVMFTRHGTRTFKLLVNMVNNEAEADLVFKSLSNALLRFLQDISLEYMGCIKRDDHVPKSVKKQAPLLTLYPKSMAGKGINELAERFLSKGEDSSADGNIKFFFRRLVAPK
ncbi:flagellar biosynthesis protein FlhG [Desulfatibacillum alkenivorans DSM 16219]|jgi:flagellar biosynthesis protein FlhG|uniref:Flagellar biosynthesis protein FlhG n=1 Tax=Desulfatibacillum alkenivorans DSM 16219 TaxID=1121393 RepID=A0A1M6HJM1_9BACT|nr:MinD/ParA family protein [Desulfatibacillum alkenivorans]SHJ22365.1 flagellar biosynthesis protein FlhG [Desulfatibacillum alkenivorans DSM 16219]